MKALYIFQKELRILPCKVKKRFNLNKRGKRLEPRLLPWQHQIMRHMGLNVHARFPLHCFILSRYTLFSLNFASV